MEEAPPASGIYHGSEVPHGRDLAASRQETATGPMVDLRKMRLVDGDPDLGSHVSEDVEETELP